MLSIGWVMFGKAVVLAIWIAAVECWRSFKRRRIENGLPMRRNRDGVYVPDDRIERLEKWARRVSFTLLGAFILYGALMVYLLTEM